ncbi:WhiB family transcriptional regulator, partial [Streptosporangium nondiastaticum]
CREVEADLFHPVGWSWDSDGARLQLARARSVCAGCPVRRPCLDDAMERGDGWSVRAGTTPEERRALGAQLTRSAR